jgi:ribosomal-protein-alanine N-acetyltransferase
MLRPAPDAWHQPMVVTDLDRVLLLEQTAYGHPWSRGNFIDSLAAGYTAELRLDGSGGLLGYFVALPGFEETHLLNLAVAPDRQRAGQGSAMLERLMNLCRQRGDQALWLEVRPSNQPALALYHRFGFVEVGKRRNYYPDRGTLREDALVMRLGLNRLDAARPLLTGPLTGPITGPDAGGPDAVV